MKISLKEKIGYGLGDTASHFVWDMVGFWILIFYTDTFGISAGIAGTIMLVARFWDMAIDPVIGIVSDRTNTRWGKFRPYILFGAIPYAVLAVLAFSTPDISQKGKIIYATVTYVLLMTAYAFINLPYSSLGAVMTNDSYERADLNSYRFFLGFAGMLVVTGLTVSLAVFFGGGDKFEATITEKTENVYSEFITNDSLKLKINDYQLGVEQIEYTVKKDNEALANVFSKSKKNSDSDNIYIVVIPADTIRKITEIPKNISDFLNPSNSETNAKKDKEVIPYVVKDTVFIVLPSHNPDSKRDLVLVDRLIRSGMIIPDSILISEHGSKDTLITKQSDTIILSDKNIIYVDTPESSVYVDVINNDVIYDEAQGYQYTLILFGVLALIFFYITFASTKERIQPSKLQEASLKSDFKYLLQNRAWIILAIVGIISFVMFAIQNAAIAYYFKYYIGDLKSVQWFNVSGALALMFVLLLTKSLALKFGSRNVFIGSSIFSGLFFISLYFPGPKDIVMIYILNILAKMAYAPAVALLWTMIADSADYGEWKTGRRATGLYFSSAVFAQKAGWGIGAAIAGWVLTAFNYVPKALIQTDHAIVGIKLLISVIPGILYMTCAIFMIFYNIDSKMIDTMKTDLDARRAKEEQ